MTLLHCTIAPQRLRGEEKEKKRKKKKSVCVHAYINNLLHYIIIQCVWTLHIIYYIDYRDHIIAFHIIVFHFKDIYINEILETLRELDEDLEESQNGNKKIEFLPLVFYCKRT